MKMLRSKKALSPVVASIILIAVTVAVSIAVAAWMGALTIGRMGTSSLTITNVSFPTNTTTIIITMKNTGTQQVTISTVKVNNVIKLSFNGTKTLNPGDTDEKLTINDVNWTAGNPYKIDLYDSTGTIVGSTQENAPTS
jgi:flagellin-like protein